MPPSAASSRSCSRSWASTGRARWSRPTSGRSSSIDRCPERSEEVAAAGLGEHTMTVGGRHRRPCPAGRSAGRAGRAAHGGCPWSTRSAGRLSGRPARAVPRACRRRAGDRSRARRARRYPSPLRAGVARAPGRRRDPRRRRCDRRPRRAPLFAPCRSRRPSSSTQRAPRSWRRSRDSSSALRRSCPSCSTRTARARASTGPTTAPTSSRPRRRSTGRSSRTSSATGSAHCPTSPSAFEPGRAASPTSPAGPAGRRSRSREHFPGHRRRRHRHRRRVDRAREGARGGAKASTAASRSVFADAAAAQGAGRYDLVTIFEALHDMAQPAEVLPTARRLLAPGGAVLIADERVGRDVHSARRRDRAAVLRLQRRRLPSQWPGRPAVGRDRDRPAAGRARGDRTRGRLQPVHDPADRARRASASTASIRRAAGNRFRTSEPGVDVRATRCYPRAHGSHAVREPVDRSPASSRPLPEVQSRARRRGGRRRESWREPSSPRKSRRATTRTFASLGIKPELRRTLGFLSNFAIAFSFISVSTGSFGNFGRSASALAGPAVLLVVVRSSSSASSSSRLVLRRAGEPLPGGRVDLPVVEAPVEPDPGLVHGLVLFLGAGRHGHAPWRSSSRFVIDGIHAAGRGQAFLDSPSPTWVSPTMFTRSSLVTTLVITTLINAFGVRLLSILNNIGVATEILGMVVFALILLFFANHQPSSILFDTGGTEAATGGNYLPAFALGMFMAIFIVYGFDTAGTFGEETIDASRQAPRGVHQLGPDLGSRRPDLPHRRSPGDAEHAGVDRGGPGWRVPDRNDHHREPDRGAFRRHHRRGALPVRDPGVCLCLHAGDPGCRDADDVLDEPRPASAARQRLGAGQPHVQDPGQCGRRGRCTGGPPDPRHRSATVASSSRSRDRA